MTFQILRAKQIFAFGGVRLGLLSTLTLEPFDWRPYLPRSMFDPKARNAPLSVAPLGRPLILKKPPGLRGKIHNDQKTDL